MLGVSVGTVGLDVCEEGGCEDGCWRRAVLTDDFTVLDAHTSAVVGPRLQVISGCGCVPQATIPTSAPQIHSCTPFTCLNGGRCIATPTHTRYVNLQQVHL